MYFAKNFFVNKETELGKYLDDMTFKSKNLYNVANYYIRQVMTGIKKDEKKITDNEKEVLSIVAQSIPVINEIKDKNYKRKVEKAKKEGKDISKIKKSKYVEMPIKEKWYINRYFLDGILKVTDNIDYRALPIQASQQILKQVHDCWMSYFASLKSYNKNPSAFNGVPKIPKYKKTGGKNEITFTNMNCKFKFDNKECTLIFPLTKLSLSLGTYIKENEDNLKEVKVIPVYNGFDVILVLENKEDETENGCFDENIILGIDLGVDNFVTTSNNIGIKPVIIKGKSIKATNQYFNKQISKYQSMVENSSRIVDKNGKEISKNRTSKRIQSLWRKREKQLKTMIQTASNTVLRYIEENHIGTVVIGKNTNWKQNSDMGKTNNQNFAYIPYNLFISDLTYKCERKGIKVILQEESYTSKASFLDNDFIPVYNSENKEKYQFSGRRIKRGLYKSKSGIELNADINGASNIIRKYNPNAFDNISDFEYLKKVYAIKLTA